jgi:hypothetical protein
VVITSEQYVWLAYPACNTPHYVTKIDVTVQGNPIQISTGTPALAAIDTGTTLIGGPSRDVRNIWAGVPGSRALTGDLAGFYTFRKHFRLPSRIQYILLTVD